MRSHVFPKISVIMPTYNRWNLLCEALESVFQQTYPHWEAVVVNDAGAPPPEPVAEMLRRRGVFFIEHPENRGLAAARNTGLSRSTGEFVAYLDDDDVFYPDHLEVLVREMTTHGWDVAYADAMRGTYETAEGKIRLLGREPAYGKDFSREDFWRSNYIPVLCVVHRRCCIEQAGNFDPLLPALEDWDLWLRMSSRYDFHHIPRVTSMFRVTSEIYKGSSHRGESGDQGLPDDGHLPPAMGFHAKIRRRTCPGPGERTDPQPVPIPPVEVQEETVSP
ncbi:MAG: multiple glycosyl transferase domain and domain protein [Deltaproteobacteria bacterium]|nr:multiple glycosyl transferase domain and domain protein [Deltaproteobacteria bacterium]